MASGSANCLYTITIGSVTVTTMMKSTVNDQPTPAVAVFNFLAGELGTAGDKSVSVTTNCRQTTNSDYITMQAFQFNKV